MACCAAYWMSRSIVSVTSEPSTAASTWSAAVGIWWPPAPTSKVALPSRPASSLSRPILEAAEPVTVGADEADDVRAELVRRVHADHRGLRVDARAA